MGISKKRENQGNNVCWRIIENNEHIEGNLQSIPEGVSYFHTHPRHQTHSQSHLKNKLDMWQRQYKQEIIEDNQWNFIQSKNPPIVIGALSELLGIDSWSAFEETVFHVGQTVQVQDHLLQEEIQRVLINMKNQKNQRSRDTITCKNTQPKVGYGSCPNEASLDGGGGGSWFPLC